MPGGKILSVGSINVDVTFQVHELVRAGETITAESARLTAGGKSANQAVAAAKLGANVALIVAIGDDTNGELALREITGAGVDVASVSRVAEAATGMAFICVDDDGENTIVIAQGANGALIPDRLPEQPFETADVVTLCLEVGESVLLAAAERAKRANATVILNLSPVRAVSIELVVLVDVLAVNEFELSDIAGHTPLGDEDMITAFSRIGVPVLIVTLGAAGATLVSRGREGAAVVERVPGVPVEAVDTTGCGDGFLGAVAVGIGQRASLRTAVELATSVGAYATTRVGAQASYPTRNEFDEWQTSTAIVPRC